LNGRSWSVRTATGFRDFRRDGIDGSETSCLIWRRNCCRGWYESELKLVLRMRNPAMFASVCLRRHEDAPTLPPKRRSQAPPSQNAWANNRPGVSHHATGSDRASAGDLS
jgi:hypothetical protein